MSRDWSIPIRNDLGFKFGLKPYSPISVFVVGTYKAINFPAWIWREKAARVITLLPNVGILIPSSKFELWDFSCTFFAKVFSNTIATKYILFVIGILFENITSEKKENQNTSLWLQFTIYVFLFYSCKGSMLAGHKIRLCRWSSVWVKYMQGSFHYEPGKNWVKRRFFRQENPLTQ